MKIQTTLLITCVITLMTACSQVKTQKYYAEHLEEAQKVVQKCEIEARKNKELKDKFVENCTNASMAVMNGMLNNLSQGLFK